MKPLVVIGIVAAFLAACSGSGKGGSSASDGDTQAALKSAVYAYSNDFVGGKEAAAYSKLSDRCQAIAGEGEFAQEVRTATRYFRDRPIVSYHLDSFDPPHATVGYAVDLKTLKTSDQPWLYEHGAWKFDAC